MKQDIVVAQDESRWVWRLRLLVAFVLLSATIAVCLTVYFQGRDDEQDSFEKDFSGLADKPVVSFKSVVQQRFGAIELFASDVTANANGSWPFVSPPAFAQRVSEVHKMAGLSLSLFLVKVEEEERTGWEEYSVAHQDWKREALEFVLGEEDVVAAPIYPQIMDLDTIKDEAIVDEGNNCCDSSVRCTTIFTRQLQLLSYLRPRTILCILDDTSSTECK